MSTLDAVEPSRAERTAVKTPERREGATAMPSCPQSDRLLSGSFIGEMYLISMPFEVQYESTVWMYCAKAGIVAAVMFQLHAAPLVAM